MDFIDDSIKIKVTTTNMNNEGIIIISINSKPNIYKFILKTLDTLHK